jgi:endonuclease YncB( thermonuclease family)
MKPVRLLVLFAALFFSTAALAAPKMYGDAVVSEVTSIYDGDTFRCNIQGYPAISGERIGIRINGIDTPEMRDNRPEIKSLARKAKQYTVQRLREGSEIVLRNMRRGKYFRIVADVYVDGRDLGKELIAMGLAKPYDGGKKPKWE